MKKLRNVVPRQGTETFENSFLKVSIILRNVVPRQGTETYHNKNTAIRNRLLRNVVPRQGTETYIQFPTASETIIEKCSSPTGDGNRQKALLLNTSTAH